MVNQKWEEPLDKTKPFDISKHIVWEAYLRVKANKGAAGIDVSLRQMCLTINVDILSIVKHICRKGALLQHERVSFDVGQSVGMAWILRRAA
jgi:hypothetical protein